MLVWRLEAAVTGQMKKQTRLEMREPEKMMKATWRRVSKPPSLMMLGKE